MAFSSISAFAGITYFDFGSTADPGGAIFSDIDGVIWTNRGPLGTYLVDETEFQNSIQILRRLVEKTQSRNVVFITNHTAVARNLKAFDEFEYRVRELFGNISQILPNVLYLACLHHPAAQNEHLRVACDCRKPKPGLITFATNYLNIDFSNSIIIGDKISDIALASQVCISNSYLVFNEESFTGLNVEAEEIYLSKLAGINFTAVRSLQQLVEKEIKF
jgi:D-glycero-D-manno-heptose 1,7-bisphosphate phosphatase